MQKEKDFIRMINWMAAHPKIRRRICKDEYTVTPEECIEILELLEKMRSMK